MRSSSDALGRSRERERGLPVPRRPPPLRLGCEALSGGPAKRTAPPPCLHSAHPCVQRGRRLLPLGTPLPRSKHAPCRCPFPHPLRLSFLSSRPLDARNRLSRPTPSL
jgi:hypothetical protein